MEPVDPGRERLPGLDVLRVTGVIAIVAGHVWTSSASLRLALYPWHVPLFFVLSGYLWVPGRSLSQEIRRRIRTLLLPYAVWFTLVSLLYLPDLEARPGRHLVRDMAILIWGGAGIGRPYSAYWFVGALFSAVIAFRLTEPIGSFGQLAVSLALFAAASASRSAFLHLPFGIGNGLACLLFLSLGRVFRTATSPNRMPTAFALTLVGLGAALTFDGLAATPDLKKLDFGTPVISVLASAALCIGLIAMAERYGCRLRPVVAVWFARLAQTGLVVVLVHAEVLELLRTTPNGAMGDFVLAVLAPWVAAVWLSRNRVGAHAVGAWDRQPWLRVP